MISLYSGTPGSGKSLHVARNIYTRLRVLKKPVIANFPVNLDKVSARGKKKKVSIGKFTYVDFGELTLDFLVNYAKENHEWGIESQTLVVIDECQILFNPRDGRKDRLDWVKFFSLHRKYGYDFILVAPFDRLLDRQIRSMIEIESKHLKNNNNGLIGMLLPFALFSSRNYWYGVRELLSADCFFYSKKYAAIYDSYRIFDEVKTTKNLVFG